MPADSTDSPAASTERTWALYATDHVSCHRWPWTREEYVTVPIIGGVVAVIGRTVGAVFRLDGDLAWTIGAILGLIAAGLVIRLGLVRKARSGFVFSLDKGIATIDSPGKLESSRVDTTRVTHVSQRDFGSDRCWLVGDGDNTLRLPLRAAIGSPAGAALIHDLMSRDGVRIDAEARRLYNDSHDLIAPA